MATGTARHGRGTSSPSRIATQAGSTRLRPGGLRESLALRFDPALMNSHLCSQIFGSDNEDDAEELAKSSFSLAMAHECTGRRRFPGSTAPTGSDNEQDEDPEDPEEDGEEESGEESGDE